MVEEDEKEDQDIVNLEVVDIEEIDLVDDPEEDHLAQEIQDLDLAEDTEEVAREVVLVDERDHHEQGREEEATVVAVDNNIFVNIPLAKNRFAGIQVIH